MTGDPDLGCGDKQTGGWIYNVLPFIEQGSLHDLGAGLTGQAKLDAYATQCHAPDNDQLSFAPPGDLFLARQVA